MELNLSYNKINSLSDLGLSITERPSQPVPIRRLTKIEVPGRDGILTIDEGSFEPIELDVEFNFLSTDKSDFDKKAKSIKNWLLSSVSNKLYLSYLDGYYKVYNVSVSDIERVDINSSGRFKVKFVCDPFLYDTIGDDIVTVNYSANTQYIVNNGYKSLPYIKIYGAGTLILNINGLAMVFTSVTDYVEIDSELVNCYKGTVNKNSTMTGDFPVLESGNNSIVMSNGITKIEIIPRWRSL